MKDLARRFSSFPWRNFQILCLLFADKISYYSMKKSSEDLTKLITDFELWNGYKEGLAKRKRRLNFESCKRESCFVKRSFIKNFHIHSLLTVMIEKKPQQLVFILELFFLKMIFAEVGCMLWFHWEMVFEPGCGSIIFMIL